MRRFLANSLVGNAFSDKLEKLTHAAAEYIESHGDPWLSPEVHKFIEELEITTPEGKQRLRRNSPQETLWEWLQLCRAERRRAKAICCKCRQQGISTWVELICWVDIYLRPHRRALLAAHDVDGAETIFIITRNYYDFYALREPKIKELRYTTKQQLHYKNPHNSIIVTTTANKRTLGSGKTINMFHASEVAKWNPATAREAMGSVQGCLARSGWDSFDFWESTAFGDEGLFAETWRDAKAQKNDYTPFFFGYQDFKDADGNHVYYFHLPEGFTCDATPEERQVQIDNNLSEGHFAFWLDKKNNAYNGSSDLAHQEFPATAELALGHSGNPLFDRNGMAWQEQWIMPPLFKVCIEFVSAIHQIVDISETVANPEEAQKDPSRGLVLEIWKKVEKGRTYILALDVGEGAKGGDYSIGHVLMIPLRPGEPFEQVAHVRSNKIVAVNFGLLAFKVGLYYNRALVGAERNGTGLAAMVPLDIGHINAPQTKGGYPRCYYHKGTDRVTNKQTDLLGWSTQTMSKRLAISNLQKIIVDYGVIIHSYETWIEIRGIQIPEKKSTKAFLIKASHQDDETKKCHDDETMGMVIGADLVRYAIEHGETAPMQDMEK